MQENCFAFEKHGRAGRPPRPPAGSRRYSLASLMFSFAMTSHEGRVDPRLKPGVYRVRFSQ